jgi:hypothetical protein
MCEEEEGCTCICWGAGSWVACGHNRPGTGASTGARRWPGRGNGGSRVDSRSRASLRPRLAECTEVSGKRFSTRGCLLLPTTNHIPREAASRGSRCRLLPVCSLCAASLLRQRWTAAPLPRTHVGVVAALPESRRAWGRTARGTWAATARGQRRSLQSTLHNVISGVRRRLCPARLVAHVRQLVGRLLSRTYVSLKGAVGSGIKKNRAPCWPSEQIGARKMRLFWQTRTTLR